MTLWTFWGMVLLIVIITAAAWIAAYRSTR